MKPSTAILELGSDFFDPVQPAQFPLAQLRFQNENAFHFLGLELSSSEIQDHFWAFKNFPNHLPQPLALRYHGHQFQNYNPRIGDGRGFTFAQFTDGQQLFEFGTKGSGTTPYSRTGDGRLTLKGAVREILCTEMLETLAVDTSKTVCVFETGESLVRGDEPSPTRSAVLTRLSRGHIRYGSFQRAAFEGRPDNILRLRDYAIKNFYPQISSMAAGTKSLGFFEAVAKRAADLVASYMIAGFVHGVLNTDNMNISGESFDYGPFRFLPHVDPRFTAAYFDHEGLYCYGRQPGAFLWNLEQLAACLKMADAAFDESPVLQVFGETFGSALEKQTLRRLNLQSRGAAEDANLVASLFTFLEESKAPFQQTLFDLHSGIETSRWAQSPQKEVYQSAEFLQFQPVLEKYQPADLQKKNHPARKRARACDLLIGEIEELWSHIANKDDWGPFEEKVREIRFFRGLI